MRPFASLLPARGATRPLSVNYLVDSLGTGLFLTGGVAFFVHVVGLTPAQVGAGFSLAGLITLGASVPTGWLADRMDTRRLLIVLHVAEAVLFCLYPLVHSFLGFVVVACATSLAIRATSTVRAALIGAVLEPDRLVAGRAYLRAVFNGGFAGGSALAAWALADGSHLACELVILGNAVTYVLAALTLIPLPAMPPRQRPAGASKAPALKDIPFVLLTLMNGLLGMNGIVLTLALPLLIVSGQGIPKALAGLFVTVNTVLIVIFQVRLSRGADTLEGGARAQRRSGFLLAVSCVGIAAAVAAHGTALKITFLTLAVLVLTAGELLAMAGSWGISYGLAPEHARGEYLGVYALGAAFSETVGPAATAFLGVREGPPGWLAIAAVFLLSGVAVVPLVARAQAKRAAAATGGATGDAEDLTASAGGAA
ncbi:MFS transporter [Streptomyces sp. NBC_01020]|uniref:MFS transporter n=1 Tax=unclassified Streptomyces TaxID=2593676 RepID=UPI002E1BAB5F|nr:MFS transporter [Streptomyces sp. NBC_01020]WSX40373.1 MFS transporter [Streptomyces sp. NBC_00963]WSX71656.1 MFS transporter [Streptomyces sp. NBC_00932]